MLIAGCTRNEPPSVSTRPDFSVDSGERVVLAGEASDPDGTVQSYRWEQIAGEPVSIGNAQRPTTQFVAPVVDAPTTLTFRLTATDDGGAAASGEVTVAVDPYGDMSIPVSGSVRNHATHAPIDGASVTVNQYSNGVAHLVGQTDTDADGGYAVQVPVAPGRLTVHVEADGYAAQSGVVTLLDEAASRTVHVDMVPVQTAQAFAAVEGVDLSVDGQPVVSLPGNAMVTGDGDAYTGQAVVSVAALDPSQDPTVMPGDFLGWDAESQIAAPIESYGAVDVALAADNGAALQLNGVDSAQISIPLARGRSPQEAPPTIPLYYWSGEQGYWIEDGEARLEEVAQGRWAYVGSVGHFSTWNADVFYESVSISGCVQDSNGDPVGFAELTARGIDYTGTSSAIADEDGQFEIEVRPNSEVELVAASDEESSDAMTISTGDGDLSLELCLVVQGERGLEDFSVQIEGETGTIDICVRDHECEDGDAISVDVEDRNVFSGEIVNEAMCSVLEVEAGRDYVIELTALNGTGFKGACNFADANTGEILVRGLNTETRVWRHREGAGSRAQIVVTTGVPQPFTIVPTPPDATVQFLGIVEREYEAGMELLAGEYRVEVSAPGYETREVAISHGSERPTRIVLNLERLFESGEVFTDALASGGEGPEMVVIPAGSFRMGCLSDEDCHFSEIPVHDVTIPRQFAVSVYEVTFAQWDACVSADGCAGYRPDDEGWGRDSRPVINVSWQNAQDYVSWLSAETDQHYRLLSEAEWEFAARAGTQTLYSWGDNLGNNRANCDGCGSQSGDRQTAPAGSFAPNAFHLYDMHGNVHEWVQDCWNGSYEGAPSDGGIWMSGDCSLHVLRSGSWFSSGYFGGVQASVRGSGSVTHAIGFRVARDLGSCNKSCVLSRSSSFKPSAQIAHRTGLRTAPWQHAIPWVGFSTLP